MFGWLKRPPLLDEATIGWLFDVYAWALREFDAAIFFQHTPLVTPDERYFPGRADNPQGMADLVLGHVQRHAALGHWPCRAVLHHLNVGVSHITLDGPARQRDGEPPTPVAEHAQLRLPYIPDMLRNPEAQIASFAHQLAHHLATLASEPPPGGEENWPHATEVLAVFLGFGVLMANTTGNVRIPKCGSCAPPPMDRQAWLSQYDISYALAIFCTLKGIPAKQATAHLKPALRGWLRRALQDVRRQAALGRVTESPDR